MRDSLQTIATAWAYKVFGRKVVDNVNDRALRVVEEAVELAQTCHVPVEQIHRLIDTVYARPTGGFSKEVGGVLVTLSVLCSSQRYSMFHCWHSEIERIIGTPDEVFQKRQAEKEAARLV